MAGASIVKPDTHSQRGNHDKYVYRPVAILARRVGDKAYHPQTAEAREGKAQVTNIVHVISKAAIDYISHDPRGAAAVLALGVAVIVAKWVWNERKGKK